MSHVWAAIAVASGLSATPVLAHAADEESCEHCQTITMDQLPPSVKDTLQKQAKGKHVEEIRKETKDGETRYQAEIVSGKTGTELELDSHGNVIKQSTHSEAAEHEHEEE